MSGMKAQLVMTIIGPDKPGLVESLAKIVSEHGGNWLESRMAQLGGQFAGILRVEVGPDDAEAMIDAIEALKESGLGILIKPTGGDRLDPPMQRVHLELTGGDHPGIVHHSLWQ